MAHDRAAAQSSSHSWSTGIQPSPDGLRAVVEVRDRRREARARRHRLLRRRWRRRRARWRRRARAAASAAAAAAARRGRASSAASSAPARRRRRRGGPSPRPPAPGPPPPPYGRSRRPAAPPPPGSGSRGTPPGRKVICDAPAPVGGCGGGWLRPRGVRQPRGVAAAFLRTRITAKSTKLAAAAAVGVDRGVHRVELAALRRRRPRRAVPRHRHVEVHPADHAVAVDVELDEVGARQLHLVEASAVAAGSCRRAGRRRRRRRVGDCLDSLEVNMVGGESVVCSAGALPADFAPKDRTFFFSPRSPSSDEVDDPSSPSTATERFLLIASPLASRPRRPVALHAPETAS